MAIQFKFSQLKEKISDAKEKARNIAHRSYPINQSRGNEFSPSTKDGKLEGYMDSTFNTKRELMALIEQAQKDGAIEIYIQGGYDGYESVQDMGEGMATETWISEWSFLFWSQEKGICFEESPLEVA